MPVFFTLVFTPLLALYIKYKLVQIAVRLSLFLAIYLSFKQGMQYVIDTVMYKMDGIQFPCMISFVLNSLDVFSMINFALSLGATIYIGRFFYNSLMKFL